MNKEPLLSVFESNDNEGELLDATGAFDATGALEALKVVLFPDFFIEAELNFLVELFDEADELSFSVNGTHLFCSKVNLYPVSHVSHRFCSFSWYL